MSAIFCEESAIDDHYDDGTGLHLASLKILTSACLFVLNLVHFTLVRDDFFKHFGGVSFLCCFQFVFFNYVYCRLSHDGCECLVDIVFLCWFLMPDF